MASATTLKSTTKTYKTFIENQCNSTTYPSDCYKSLSSYASTVKTNPVNLCNTSLYVTLKAARSYYVSISSLTKQKGLSHIDKGIVKDCVDVLGDCVDELTQSLNAMTNLGGSYEEIQFQMSNIKTWVSASITYEDTCTDGFLGRKPVDWILDRPTSNKGTPRVSTYRIHRYSASTQPRLTHNNPRIPQGIDASPSSIPSVDPTKLTHSSIRYIERHGCQCPPRRLKLNVDLINYCLAPTSGALEIFLSQICILVPIEG
ncbi:hypothetical protein Dsin_014931 [Dipteronia sinensis]|uniref:Pectinesterase inhibitor domain-containing protein n=1 Tax=Dipteronia sinensis TaxID=43782 RepID=A0AAE0AMP5_9ROSI|nr:hypothetical protein Dsin_014931 [Dipteronia sinensis]